MGRVLILESAILLGGKLKMNPLKVNDWESALMALGIGFGVGVLVTVVMYFLSPAVAKVQSTVAGS